MVKNQSTNKQIDKKNIKQDQMNEMDNLSKGSRRGSPRLRKQKSRSKSIDGVASPQSMGEQTKQGITTKRRTRSSSLSSVAILKKEKEIEIQLEKNKEKKENSKKNDSLKTVNFENSNEIVKEQSLNSSNEMENGVKENNSKEIPMENSKTTSRRRSKRKSSISKDQENIDESNEGHDISQKKMGNQVLNDDPLNQEKEEKVNDEKVLMEIDDANDNEMKTKKAEVQNSQKSLKKRSNEEISNHVEIRRQSTRSRRKTLSNENKIENTKEKSTMEIKQEDEKIQDEKVQDSIKNKSKRRSSRSRKLPDVYAPEKPIENAITPKKNSCNEDTVEEIENKDMNSIKEEKEQDNLKQEVQETNPITPRRSGRASKGNTTSTQIKYQTATPSRGRRKATPVKNSEFEVETESEKEQHNGDTTETESEDQTNQEIPEEISRRFYGVVWAKLSSFSYWPAFICHPQDLQPNLRQKAYSNLETHVGVYFYGSNNFAVISFKSGNRIIEWDKAEKKYFNGYPKVIRKGKQRVDFEIAIQHAQEDIKREKIQRLGWSYFHLPVSNLPHQSKSTKSTPKQAKIVPNDPTISTKEIFKRKRGEKQTPKGQIKMDEEKEKENDIETEDEKETSMEETKKTKRRRRVSHEPSKTNPISKSTKHSKRKSLSNIEISKNDDTEVKKKINSRIEEEEIPPKNQLTAEKKRNNRRNRKSTGNSKEKNENIEITDSNKEKTEELKEESNQTEENEKNESNSIKKEQDKERNEIETDQMINLEERNIQKLTKKLRKLVNDENFDRERILKVCHRLLKMNFWFDILMSTGLPRVINSLRKHDDDEIAKLAKAVRKHMMDKAGVQTSKRKSISDSVTSSPAPQSVPSDSPKDINNEDGITKEGLNLTITKNECETYENEKKDSPLINEKPKKLTKEMKSNLYKDPTRQMGFDMIYKSMIKHVMKVKTDEGQKLCKNVENAIYDRFQGTSNDYKKQIRQISFGIQELGTSWKKLLNGEDSVFDVAFATIN